MGDRGEHKCMLDDVFGISKVTVQSCYEKRLEKKLCKRRQNSPTVVKVVENKFGQVVEKSFDFVLCVFGFV